MKPIREGLTFDDVLLAPRFSAVHPKDTDVRTRFARGVDLNIPLVSAAMDTVTAARMALALAREGGVGVIHKNLSIEEQAAEVDRVKRSESGMIQKPYTLGPDRPIRDARRLMETRGVSGVPVVEDGGRLLGIITNRDLLFETDESRTIREVMTGDTLVTAPAGTTLEDAEAIMGRHKIEKLPIVDEEGRLHGLLTVKDILQDEHQSLYFLRWAPPIFRGKRVNSQVFNAEFHRSANDAPQVFGASLMACQTR